MQYSKRQFKKNKTTQKLNSFLDTRESTEFDVIWVQCQVSYVLSNLKVDVTHISDAKCALLSQWYWWVSLILYQKENVKLFLYKMPISRKKITKCSTKPLIKVHNRSYCMERFQAGLEYYLQKKSSMKAVSKNWRVALIQIGDILLPNWQSSIPLVIFRGFPPGNYLDFHTSTLR